MIVAVTGGTGLVGQFLVPALLRRGHTVRLLVRPRGDRTIAPRAGVTLVTGRLDELDAIERLVHGADAILHGAFEHPVEPPVPGRTVAEHYVQTNYVGSLRLLERTTGLGAQQIVYVSSLAVFGHDPNVDPLGLRFARDESFPLWPDAFYGALRAGVEKMVIAAAKAYGINGSCFRLGCVLGERGPWSEMTAAPIVDEAREHGEIRTTLGAYVLDASDAAELLARAIGDASLRGKVFNTFDRWIDFAECAPILSGLLGRAIRVACPPAREPHSPILGDALHAWFDDFHTTERLKELLAAMVSRRARESGKRPS